MWAEAEGTISYSKRGKPTLVEKNGKTFITFDLWTPDLTREAVKDENGRKKRSLIPIQIRITGNDYGKKIFPYLASGRLIRVEGDFTSRPYGKVVDGEVKAYANNKIFMKKLVFLDEQPARKCKNVLDILMRTKAIDSTQYTEFMAAHEDYYTSLRQKELEKEDNSNTEDVPFEN